MFDSYLNKFPLLQHEYLDKNQDYLSVHYDKLPIKCFQLVPVVEESVLRLYRELLKLLSILADKKEPLTR